MRKANPAKIRLRIFIGEPQPRTAKPSIQNLKQVSQAGHLFFLAQIFGIMRIYDFNSIKS